MRITNSENIKTEIELRSSKKIKLQLQLDKSDITKTLIAKLTNNNYYFHASATNNRQ